MTQTSGDDTKQYRAGRWRTLALWGFFVFIFARELWSGYAAGVKEAQVNVATAQADLISLQHAIILYQLTTGVLPASLEDLIARPPRTQRWVGPYTSQSQLHDPWGRGYVYKLEPSGKKYTIGTYGGGVAPGTFITVGD